MGKFLPYWKYQIRLKKFKCTNTLAYYCPAFRDEDKRYDIDTRSHDKKLFSLSLTVGQNKINCLYLVRQKRSSLFVLSVSDKKKFYNIGA